MTLYFSQDTGPYSGTGNPLTEAQGNGNILDLDTRIKVLEDALGTFGVEVVNTAGSLTFNWSDDTVSGPFPLPVAVFNPKGEWHNDMVLSRLDVVSSTGGAGTSYVMVLQDHVTPASPATFDIGAGNTTGNYYFPLFIGPDMSLVARWRDEYQVAREYEVNDLFFDTTFGTFVVLVAHVSAVTFDPRAVDDDENRLYRRIAPPVSQPKTSAAATYTISEADVGQYLVLSGGAEVRFVAGLDIDIGDEIEFRDDGTDRLTFVAYDTGVTLNPARDGYEKATSFKGDTVRAKYRGADMWDLIGAYGDAI